MLLEACGAHGLEPHAHDASSDASIDEPRVPSDARVGDAADAADADAADAPADGG